MTRRPRSSWPDCRSHSRTRACCRRRNAASPASCCTCSSAPTSASAAETVGAPSGVIRGTYFLLLDCFGADDVRRDVGRVLRSATPISDRSASLTSRSVEKTRATSGASNTRFVPASNCRRYFPRTPTPRSSVRYSSRRLLFDVDLALLVDLALMPGRLSGADDADAVTTLHVGDDE